MSIKDLKQHIGALEDHKQYLCEEITRMRDALNQRVRSSQEYFYRIHCYKPYGRWKVDVGLYSSVQKAERFLPKNYKEDIDPDDIDIYADEDMWGYIVIKIPSQEIKDFRKLDQIPADHPGDYGWPYKPRKRVKIRSRGSPDQ